ncbi:MAG: DUF2330 domain-containing protein [Myxococcota bacterium]
MDSCDRASSASRLAGSALLLISAGASPAFACGGMFCDPGPLEVQVVQNAERIAFHVDERLGTVEAHVQIFYEGPPDQFGWVVPVSAQPEVFLSTDALFEALGTRLAPTVRLNFASEGNCGGRSGCAPPGVNRDASSEVDSGLQFDTDAPPVEVVDEGQVGPYDFVVLQADTSDALVSWLQGHQFAIPDTLTGVLAPYLTPDAHFLAVRLSKDADAGDIAPLGWRYDGDAASIPIQLTSIAAAPDLRLEVSVFGDGRAVPESYLHVTLNEAQLDWFNGGTNYYDVVSRAADQAGGHAFATDYAGPPDLLAGFLWTAAQQATSLSLADAADATQFAQLWNELQVRPNANVRVALGGHLDPAPEDGRLDAGMLDGVDLAALYTDLDRYVFEPLRVGEALFATPWVTRMSSSLDAAEMTVDPVFVVNHDMNTPVSNLHEARFVTECDGKGFNEAPRRLELSDGRVYRFPPTSELRMTDGEFWLSEQSDIEAILVERTGKNGLPEVVSDLTESAWAEVDTRSGKCGCAPSAAPFAGWLLAMVGGSIVRRRRG